MKCDCRHYRQGSSEIWPRICVHWTGAWCQFLGGGCAHKAFWSPPLTETERSLLRYQGPPPEEDCDA